jgi:hypothetical protein
MTEKRFELVLIQIAEPRLESLGYAYDTQLKDRDILFGFSKRLDKGIFAIIEFQRHQYEEEPWGWGFRVNLIRSKTEKPAKWDEGHYPGYLNERLSFLIWVEYSLRIYPGPDHWWEAANVDGFETQLLDALGKIEQFGIPWLEDPESRMSSEGPFDPSSKEKPSE